MKKEQDEVMQSTVVAETGMTKEEIEQFVSGTLYKLAGSYAKRNPVVRVLYEDYVQELVVDVWRKIDTYNCKRSGLSTFCHCRFGVVKFKLVQAAQRELSTVSLDSLIDDDGHTLSEFISDNIDDVVTGTTVEDILSRVRPETQMCLYGYTRQEVADKFHKTKSQIDLIVQKDMTYLKKMLAED